MLLFKIFLDLPCFMCLFTYSNLNYKLMKNTENINNWLFKNSLNPLQRTPNFRQPCPMNYFSEHILKDRIFLESSLVTPTCSLRLFNRNALKYSTFKDNPLLFFFFFGNCYLSSQSLHQAFTIISILQMKKLKFNS